MVINPYPFPIFSMYALSIKKIINFVGFWIYLLVLPFFYFLII